MTILFTKRAERNYNSIKDFITKRWGVKIAESFEINTIDFLNILQEFPEIGTVEVVEKDIRAFQLTRQTRLFYRIKGGRIIILALFDVRQNPDKKPI